MATEIERKFRIKSLGNLQLPEGVEIDQGYLCDDPLVVRVRTMGERAYLTIKFAPPGPQAPGAAIERKEFEYEIPKADALELLNQCKARLTKVRHYLDGGIELDIFKGRYEGLIVAEYESPDGGYPRPIHGVEWQEVTADRRYSNAALAKGDGKGEL